MRIIIPALILTLYYSLTNLPFLQQNHQVLAQQLISSSQQKQNRLTTTEAIKLAKQAASKLKSPPRIYAFEGRLAVGGNLNYWPNQPGSVNQFYNTCGAPPAPGLGITCQKPIKQTVIVKPSKIKGGYNVIFLSSWGTASRPNQHSWQFEVSPNRKVKFIREEGDGLPGMVQ